MRSPQDSSVVLKEVIRDTDDVCPTCGRAGVITHVIERHVTEAELADLEKESWSMSVVFTWAHAPHLPGSSGVVPWAFAPDWMDDLPPWYDVVAIPTPPVAPPGGAGYAVGVRKRRRIYDDDELLVIGVLWSVANNFRIRQQSNPGAGVLTTLYTVPVGVESIISSGRVCNRSATPTSFRVSVAVLGAADDPKQYLYYDLPIIGNDTFAWTLGETLQPTDEIRVYAALATLSFHVFGTEVTP